jgi:hypothetical protein
LKKISENQKEFDLLSAKQEIAGIVIGGAKGIPNQIYLANYISVYGACY